MNEESLFHLVLQQPEAARAAFLEQACANEPELRARLEKLLQAHEAPDSLFDKPAVQADTSAEAAPRESPGTRIGPYKLLEQIGEGGMGLVFVAEQQQPVRRKVALKVIKPGMDTRQVVARFEAERQALALMDHPHIAKVLDAGATDSGRPYFVMELVKGVPITDYCDHHRVPIRERLELFVHVCQAVQHAHQKGIIHRDLKPSNVMVMSRDGTPVVKVIDFGVAKAMGQQLTDKTIYTQFAQLVGTPLYMSPEQAGQSGLDVDTRSDIYSLGALLFELLTGTTPFTKERLREVGHDEMRRIIREEEPPKPSTRISTLGQAATTVSTQRQSDPKQLSRLFRGELDWIVMKALEKDRNRRYETAIGLARDIQHYLHDEPVVAGPPSSAYRLRKFIRRNRGPVLAATLIVVLLVGGIIGTTLGLVRESIQRVQAEQARREAVASAERAEAHFEQARTAVDEMYTQVAEKWLAQQPQLEPVQREFLQKALAFFQQFAQVESSEPTVRFETARAYRRVGEIQHKLGAPSQAEQAFEEAIDRLQELVNEFPNEPEYRHDLAAALHQFGLLLGDIGREDEEGIIHRRALDLQEKLVAEFPAVAKYRRDLGRGYCMVGGGLGAVQAGSWAEREKALRTALETQNQLVADFPKVPEYREDLAMSLIGLARNLRSTGRPAESQKEFREASRILEKLAAEFPSVPLYRNSLAYVYCLQADVLAPPEAEKSLGKALGLQRKLAADFPSIPDFRYDILRSLLSLGKLLQGAKRPQEAEQAYREALVVGEKLAADSPTVHYHRGGLAGVYTGLAALHRDANRLAEAEAAYRHSITLYEKVVAEFPNVEAYPRALIESYFSLGSLLLAAGRVEEVKDLYNKVIERNPKNANLHNDLAWLLATTPDPKFRDVKRAVELAKKAVELAPKEGGHWNTLGVAQYRAGDWKAAIAAFQKSIELRQGGDSFDWFFLAMAHWQQGDKETARKWYDKAVAWMDKNQPKNEELRRFRTEAAELLKVEQKKD